MCAAANTDPRNGKVKSAIIAEKLDTVIKSQERLTTLVEKIDSNLNSHLVSAAYRQALVDQNCIDIGDLKKDVKDLSKKSLRDDVVVSGLAVIASAIAAALGIHR